MSSDKLKQDYPEVATTRQIIGAAMDVHQRLGPGFLESVYDEALAVELGLREIKFERQKELPVMYRGEIIKRFGCDFLVSDKVVVELKAMKEVGEIEKVQVVSYLKASGLEIGLLLNFGCKSLVFKRLINSKDGKENQ
jgi:GxxExxY protein